MEYRYLIYFVLFLVGAFIYYKIHLDRLQARKDKMGMFGSMNIDIKLGSFFIITYLLSSAVYYLYKFIYS